MHENEISKIILDCAFKIHTDLGPGLFESVYEEILYNELINKRLNVERQKVLPIRYGETRVDNAFRIDLVIDNKVIVEIKSVEKVLPVHQKQLLTYLKLSGLKLGLLINFNEAHLKDGTTRIVNKLT